MSSAATRSTVCVRASLSSNGVSNNRWGVTNAWYIGGVNCFLP